MLEDGLLDPLPEAAFALHLLPRAVFDRYESLRDSLRA
jgi:hypothetical protein